MTDPAAALTDPGVRARGAGAEVPAQARRGPRSAWRELLTVARLDVGESLRARWFAGYALLFGSVVALLFAFGLTESRVLGFMGLSRLLVTYIQLCLAILPIFVLITTVRSVAGDREAGVYEYVLSLPVSLGAWFFGKALGRLVVVYLPALLAMTGAAVFGWWREIPVEWELFGSYAALLGGLSVCFLGLAMGISALARSTDVAQGAAFLCWLVLVLLLDLVLLGVLVQQHASPELVVAIALANPLQVFRTAALLLFDPQLVLLGPAAVVILDRFGNAGYLTFAAAYPTLLGLVAAGLGFWRFRRGDLP